jgi:DNA-binding transcriptional ArsR family regulator
LEVDVGSEPVSSLRALAHPVRLRMLSLLTSTSMSAAEVARELQLTQANASYHMRVLAQSGFVVEAGEEKIRGGVAKRYRHPWDAGGPDPASGPPTADDHRLYVETLTHELVRRHSEVVPGRGHMTDAEMWVSPEVWDGVLERVREASALLHSSARPPRTAGTIHVNLSMVAFRMRSGEEVQA